MRKKSNIFLVIFTLLLVFNIKVIKADNIYNDIPNVKLEGNADGIVYILGDEPFLYKANMLPGDMVSRNLSIHNKHDAPYEVYMRAERKTPNEKYDLIRKIELKITYEGKIVYEGMVSGESGLEKNIYLGKVNPNEIKKLEAEVILEGNSTGNEYKNKNGEVEWIFTAVKIGGDNQPNTTKYMKINIVHKLPKTGQIMVFLYVLIGIILLSLGVILTRKGGKKHEKNNS